MRLRCWVVCLAACGHSFDAAPPQVDGGTPDGTAPDSATPDAAPTGALAIEPPAIRVPAGRDQPFVASSAVTWSVMEPGGGTIDAAGMYIAPDLPGTYHVKAIDSDGNVAMATVDVEQMYISLLSGRLGFWGNADGVGAAARFTAPGGLVYDGVGTMYVADGKYIRAIDVATGRVTTLAGGGIYTHYDGVGADAYIGVASGLAYDATTQRLYFSDRSVNTIRMIDVPTRTVTTIAGGSPANVYVDGPGATARFRSPFGMCLSGTTLYIADLYSYTIRTLDTASPTYDVSTFAGTPNVSGFANSTDPLLATFNGPADIACTPSTLYVADYMNGAIRTIDRTTGEVATLAGSPTATFGDGSFASAGLDKPSHVVADPAHGALYISGAVHPGIRKLDIAAQTVTSLADSSTGFALLGAKLWYTRRSAYDVRTLDLVANQYATVAGAQQGQGIADGPLSQATFVYPQGLTVGANANVIVGSNFSYRRLSLAAGDVTTFAGQPGVWGYTDGGPGVAKLDGGQGIAIDPQGRVWQPSPGGAVIREIHADGTVTSPFGGLGIRASVDGVGTAARFNLPEGVVWVNGSLIVTDIGDATIRSIDLSSGMVTTIAGVSGVRETVDGVGTAAHFQYPYSIATDGKTKVWIDDWADSGSVLRELDLTTGAVTTIAGDQSVREIVDGVGSAAHFCMLYAMAYDGEHSLYVAEVSSDQYDRQVAAIRRVWLPSHAVSTYAGQGLKYGGQVGPVQSATIAQPEGIAVSPSGNVLFTGENAIFAIVPE